jgi:hypothetical protein
MVAAKTDLSAGEQPCPAVAQIAPIAARMQYEEISSLCARCVRENARSLLRPLPQCACRYG